MTRCVILNILKRDSLLDFRGQWQQYLRERYIDFVCIELIDGTFCTPSVLMQDARFKPLKDQLEGEGKLSDLTIRDVSTTEIKPIIIIPGHGQTGLNT